MANLDQIRAEVEENGSVTQSAITLIGGLAQQIRDLSTDPAALQALADQLDSQNSALAAAVAANTPASDGGTGATGGGEPTPTDGGTGEPTDGGTGEPTDGTGEVTDGGPTV